MVSVLHIAFIGFGELGQRFARDLRLHRRIRLSAYDVLFADPIVGAALCANAEAMGVRPAQSGADACQTADVIISAVTADQTEAVALMAAGYVQMDQIFLDVNSASPSTKMRAAAQMTFRGAAYVEGAVMGAVKTPGDRVDILVGGPLAARVAEILNAVGMNLTPVAETYGKASAIKLCRSIIIKGLEALMVDCAAATRHWGVEREVYASLSQTFPSIDWPDLAADMSERVATHGVRRAAEMGEAADMLQNMGLVPDLARAVAATHARGAKLKRNARS